MWKRRLLAQAATALGACAVRRHQTGNEKKGLTPLTPSLIIVATFIRRLNKLVQNKPRSPVASDAGNQPKHGLPFNPRRRWSQSRSPPGPSRAWPQPCDHPTRSSINNTIVHDVTPSRKIIKLMPVTLEECYELEMPLVAAGG